MNAGCSALFALLALVAFGIAVEAMRRANAAQRENGQLRSNLADLHRWAREWRSGEGQPNPASGAGQPPSAVQPEPVVETPKPVEPAPKPAPPVVAAPAPAQDSRGRLSSIAKPPRQPFDWEALVGVKLFSWIAGISLALAGIFFLKYGVEHNWLNPTVRASLGIITGIALLVVCELRVARDYTFTINALDGAGIAILYATLFAMHAMWHLLPIFAAFGLMLLVTAVAVALSIRRNSIFIALLGLLGGFATPALLSTGENRAIGLFSYLLLLNVGLAWVATTKRWPILTAITVVFTAIYQWAWITKFLTASQLPLAATIFIVFGATAAASLWIGRKPDQQQKTFDTAALAGATLPLLFAVVAAAVPAYASRYTVLFAFLLMVTVGLSVIAIRRGPEWLHILGGATIVLVFAIWTTVSYSPRAWPAVLGWLAAFVVAQLAASHFTKHPHLSVAPLLLFMFPALAAVERATASPLPLFGTLFVLFAIISAYSILHDEALLYIAAAFFTVGAEAVWSSRYLNPDRLLSALAIYGVFALLFLGVPIAARIAGRPFGTGRARTILLLLSIAILFFLAAGPVAAAALWGLAILLGILNAGALLEARATSNAIFAAAGILLSWIVLAVWCATSLAIVNLVPALAVIGAFALLVVTGNAWASRDSDEFGSAAFLGLAGHLFLIAVAAQKSLAFPPWPLFAILLVLDLAIGIAALYIRRDRLMVAAMGASQLVLMVWTSNAQLTPWPNVALLAAIAICAIALAWFAMSRAYTLAAIVALFLGDVVAIIAGNVAVAPLSATLLAAHVVILIAILAVAWLTDIHDLAPLAVPLFAIATALDRQRGLGPQLGFSTALYAPFIAYPLLLGRRAKQTLQPYLGAVLASVPFFFFARRAILDANFGYAIGLLPVFQALLMIALLLRLLRIEGPAERTINRLALVSAAALAFITVAIPLQLAKQWITIGWALEAAALVWLFTRIPHRGLLLWSAGLFAAVFARLVFNTAVFEYHPVSHTAIFNWYLYTYLVSAAAFFAAVRLLPKEEARRQPWSIPALASGGTILLFFLLNIEIADYYSKGRALTFNFFSSSLAQDLTYTIGWAVFAVGMLTTGIVFHSRGTRVAAILLLLSTVLKCFLHDLARLGGLYRVGSLLGLALSLVLVGVLLQRFVMKVAHADATEELS